MTVVDKAGNTYAVEGLYRTEAIAMISKYLSGTLGAKYQGYMAIILDAFIGRSIPSVEHVVAAFPNLNTGITKELDKALDLAHSKGLRVVGKYDMITTTQKVVEGYTVIETHVSSEPRIGVGIEPRIGVGWYIVLAIIMLILVGVGIFMYLVGEGHIFSGGRRIGGKR